MYNTLKLFYLPKLFNVIITINNIKKVNDHFLVFRYKNIKDTKFKISDKRILFEVDKKLS